MSIIFKFILINIKEKKLRTFLIIFSIMISTALFLASMAASENLAKLARERTKAYVGMAEILVYAGEKSPSRFFKAADAYNLKNDMEFISEVFIGRGSYKYRNGKNVETVNFELGGLDGIDPDTLKKTGRIKLVEERGLFPFEGNKLIVGSLTAKKYSLKPGEKIEIFIDGAKHNFFISGIAAQEGIYLEDGYTNRLTVPIDTLRSIYGLKGRVTHLLIKPKELDKKKFWISELSKLYNNYDVKEAILDEDLRNAISGVTVPLILALILVLFISVFIIYVSFKVIAAERLPVIGTFRSIGATRSVTDFVMFAESLAYGVAGGIAGCILGSALVLQIVGMLSDGARKGAGAEFGIMINPLHVMAAFLLALFLSVVSSAVPIIRVSRIPVKDIVLNKIEKQRSNKIWKPAVGCSLLIFYFAAPSIVPNDMALPVNLICLVFVAIGIVTFIPWMTAGMVKIFEKLYVAVFGNIGILAAKNLRENKSVLTNITLMAMGIGALLMIFTVSFTAFERISGTYKDVKFSIMIAHVNNADRNVWGQVRTISGIKEAYGLYSAEEVEITGTKERIQELIGVDKSIYGQYFDMHCQGNEKQLYEELEQGRNILLPGTLKKVLKVKKGDYISLQSPKGKLEYKITGFFNSTWQNGRAALISEKYVKMDFEQRYYNSIFVKADQDEEGIIKVLKERFRNRNIYTITTKELEGMDNKKFGPVIFLMKGFSIMAMLIGVFGVLNNFAISFLERKRSIAMMRAVGLSKNQTVAMIFIEALTGGLIGGIIGIVIGVLSARLIPYVLLAINLPDISMSYSPVMIAQFILCGILVTVVASISPALKSSRLNIIEAVKYE